MFLPIGDEPNPRNRPIVTWALMAVNIAVFALVTLPLIGQPPGDHPLLLQYLEVMRTALGDRVSLHDLLSSIRAYDLFVFEHGFKPGAPAVDDLMVSMFLHGGFMHLIGNMLFLYIYGDNVEARLGKVKYLFAYLITGAIATGTQAVFSAGSLVPVVGASGAISGVLGFYFLFFPKNRIKVFTVLFPFYVGVVHIPARWVLGAYLIIDNIFPFLFIDATTGVAHGAHIGGFIAGLMWARFAAAEEVGGSLQTGRVLQGLPGMSPQHHEGLGNTPPEVVRRLIREGDMTEAVREYSSIWGTKWRRAVPPFDSLAIADHLAARGRHDAALGIYQTVARDDPKGPYAARAHVGAGDMLLNHLDKRTGAYQHYAMALELTPDPVIERQARDGLSTIARMQRMVMSS